MKKSGISVIELISIGIVIGIFVFAIGIVCYRIFLEYRLLYGVLHNIQPYKQTQILLKDIIVIDAQNKEHTPSNINNLL